MEAPKRTRVRSNGVAGAGVDSQGRPVLDPTANVLALVEAANKRRDDLSELADTLQKERIKRVEDLQVKDFAHSMALFKLNAECQKEIAAVHEKHDDRLHGILSDNILALTARIGPMEQMVYESRAKGVGLANAWGYLVGAAGLFATLIMIGLFLFQRQIPATTTLPQPQAQPQVYYVPAPPNTLIPQSGATK